MAACITSAGVSGVLDAVSVESPRKDSLYEPGERSDASQKLKLENQQEFVIGGYRPNGHGVDAVLVGYYDDTGLRVAGLGRWRNGR